MLPLLPLLLPREKSNCKVWLQLGVEAEAKAEAATWTCSLNRLQVARIPFLVASAFLFGTSASPVAA